MKIHASIVAVALAAVSAAFPARAAVNTVADIIFVVDESGSMSGEHAWLGGMATTLNTKLIAAGVTDAKFGLVGFGGGGAGNSGRTLTDFTSVGNFATATGGLVISGSQEDGYAGINYGLNTLSFRAGSAVNVILVTDEDRDNSNGALTYASILAALNAKGALLNVVVNGDFRTSGGAVALGHDSDNNAYTANGSGGFNTSTPVGTRTGAGTTINDYYNMALATGGAAWDLNQLRAGGNTATSFTAAFVDIKVAEISVQRAPDGGSTVSLLLLGMSALVLFRRRQAA